MYSLPHLLLAALAGAALTAVLALWLARVQARRLQAAAERERDLALRRQREGWAEELRELQASLSGEVEQLRERVNNPLRNLLETLRR